jgi:hypothetical protein
MSITNPKERKDCPPDHDNNTGGAGCQEKNTLVQDTINEIWNKIEIFPHGVRLVPSDQYKKGYKKNHRNRGIIHTFSRRSRFRLFKLFSMLDNNLDFPPIFVTLTYHYGHENNPSPRHSQLHNFLVQLRNFDPNVQFIWRKEIQMRGAPHYHLIIFPSNSCPFSGQKDYSIKVSLIWHLIADPKSRKHKEYGCLIKNITSYKEACCYISKYIGKVPKHIDDILEGKQWGCSRKLPIKLIHTIKLNERGYEKTLNTIRKWLLNKGKEIQASQEYLNIFHEQYIFIDYDEFVTIISEESSTILHH